MKRGIKKEILLSGAIFALILAGCNNERTFEVYDTDSSGELSRSEFEAAFNDAEWFVRYDKNNNGIFEQNEFILASFDYWDHNDDDILEEDEFDEGVNNFYYPYQYGVYGYYGDWDVDDNDELEEDEFKVAYARTDIMQTIDADADGSLSKEEVSNIMFKAMDENNDNEISESEFGEDVLVKGL